MIVAANRNLKLAQTEIGQLRAIGRQQVAQIQYQQRQIANRDTQLAHLRAQLTQAQNNARLYANQFSQCHTRRIALSAEAESCHGRVQNLTNEIKRLCTGSEPRPCICTGG